MSSAQLPPPRRPVRSYVLRGGRMGPGQERALRDLAPGLSVAFASQPLDRAAVFGRQAPLIVEIGVGMGDATARMAAADPQRDYLGIEVHEAGVGALLRRIEKDSLHNLRIVQHDAVEVMRHMLVADSLAAIHVFFPDPWPKKRHHKRRLIQAPLAALLATRLAPGGRLHCATDWQPYADQMLAVLAAEPLLINTATGFAPRPDYRPMTKFEARGVRLSHGVWDLVFERV